LKIGDYEGSSVCKAILYSGKLTLRWLMSYIYIWSTHSWCF
jgi:hypothetical protein